LSQFSVNTHYLALRTTVKKLVVLIAFLFTTVTANQAVACDMGAIETWVAAACQRDGCETKSTTKNSAEGCDGGNCTALYSTGLTFEDRALQTDHSPSILAQGNL
jgi:hypothetical protein